MTTVWVNRPTPEEEGRQKSDRHGIEYRMSGGGGRIDLVHNIGVDPQLRVMEILGKMMPVARCITSAAPWRRMVRRSAYAITLRENVSDNACDHTHPCGYRYRKM